MAINFYYDKITNIGPVPNGITSYYDDNPDVWPLPFGTIDSIDSMVEVISSFYYSMQKNNVEIRSFQDLVDKAVKEKEIELKYDLERNVKLVSFNKGKINISFNEKLNKNFIKNLTEKLLLKNLFYLVQKKHHKKIFFLIVLQFSYKHL